MTSHNNPSRPQLFGLFDGAVCPARIRPLLEESGTTFESVFAGLSEIADGPASLFLARIDDPEASWVQALDQIDLYAPCMSLIWSRVGLDEMARHLRAFLFSDIGDGMMALIRFFDPRNTGAVMQVWGEQIRNIFMGPIDRWMYRGRHDQWQCIENDALYGSKICKSIMIQLEPADLDTLAEHTEPDEVLASLIQQGVIDETHPYLARFTDFLPRYRNALQWGLAQPSDRMNFCRHTYLYGRDFDQHDGIHHALSRRKKTGESYQAVIGRIPSHVWDDLARRYETRTNVHVLNESDGVPR